MDLVTPGIGLIFWTALTFSIVFFVLRSFAWKPITTALKEREESIANALSAAEKAKADLQQLQASNEQLLQEARNERERILRDAKSAADKMVAEATDKATTERNRIIAEAQEVIRQEKNAALAEVKKQIAGLSIDIAEKVMRKQLADKSSQMDLVQSYLQDIKIN
jgi:F-type H+-transporting ATPase subunit b